MAIIFLFIVYGFLLGGVAFINFVYFKFFQRANLKVDYKEEVIELGAYAKMLYDKDQLYQSAKLEEYRVILRDEMFALLDTSEKKAEFIKHIATVPSIRKGPDSLKDNMIQDYENFFASIRGRLDSNKLYGETD